MNLTFEQKLRLVTGEGMWHNATLGGVVDAIHLSDGPHGLRKQDEEVRQNNLSYTSTCFPTASAVACSWNIDLIAKMAKGIAKEARAEQVSVVLGPGTNIKRSPTCGRNFEYFSEDPYLAGRLASSYVAAMQEEGVGTSLKHFAGNSQETKRMTENSMIDERALREIYLRAFEMCVRESQPATIMASYNRLNGQFACRNKWLLTDVLRNDWGFKGLVVSDWGASNNLGEGIEAGLDLEMPDNKGYHYNLLKADVLSGRTKEASLDRAVNNVLSLVEKYKYNKDEKYVGITKELLNENNELARKIEEESAVLLKNDGILPLCEKAKVLIIGDMAKTVRFQGGGSSHITPPFVKDYVKAFEDIGYNVDYSKGYNCITDVIDIELEKEAIEAAMNAAKDNVPVLFIGGLTDITEGEGYDRKTFSMPENQEHLFDKIYQVNPNIIFISVGGSPYDMKKAEKAKAVLMMYLGGEAVADACASLISGKVTPSGKLAETYPYSYKDTPAYGNYATDSNDVEYRESLYIGYRYYDTFGIPVHFKFGFGMSYTSFEYSDLTVLEDRAKVKLRFNITNTGDFDGAEIAQAYVKNSKGDFIRAKKELRGFTKVFLKAGETKEVEIELDDRSFMIFDSSKGEYITVNGEYEIVVAASIDDERLSSSYAVRFGVDYSKNDKSEFSSYFTEDSKVKPGFTECDFLRLYDKEKSNFDNVTPGNFDMCNSLRELAKHSLLGKIVLKFAVNYMYSLFKGKPKDDPEVMMMVEAITDGTLDLVLCQSDGAIPYKLGEAIVLSANGKKGKAFVKLISKQ